MTVTFIPTGSTFISSRRVAAPLRAFGLSIALAAVLSACGGGGSDAGSTATTGGTTATTPAATIQLKGTAATGAAIANATVTAVNAAGKSVTAQTGADGSYTIDIAEGAPYALSVTDALGKAWYSFAQAAGTANITPLTTLAVLEANGGRPLIDLLKNWSATPLDAAAVLEAAKKVNANLKSVMQSKGIDYTSANVFADAFTANGKGIDAVLDAMKVSFSCSISACTQTINSPAGQTLVTWNGNILTTGISVSWSSTAGGVGSTGTVTASLGSCRAPVAGTYSLVVETTVTGAPIPVPTVCIDGLPDKPASQAEFCGAGVTTQQLPPGVQIVSCSYSGNSGTIAARIFSPVALDYTVKYTFVKN